MTFVPTEILRFRYADIFFSYYIDNYMSCSKKVHDHMLAYVYSGEMILEENGQKIAVHKGECVFLRRDNQVAMTKQPLEGEQFQGIFMQFQREFLREFFKTLPKEDIPAQAPRSGPSVVKLPKTPDIDSLFQAMIPYFDASQKPSEALMKLKLQEGVHSLLNIDVKFYSSLFDFTEPWKIDLLDFMEKNFLSDLTLEEFASYTGRSLATFKRDFKKISDLSPQKWLMEKRLEAAHEMLLGGKKKVSDIYLEVGFKNLSHFSTAYKKKYGASPTH